MPLDKEKYNIERKRYAMLSSGMFLVMIAMIAGLAYISFDNVQKKWEIQEKEEALELTYQALEDSTVKLKESKEELNRAVNALKAAELIHESFVDSIISGGSQMQQKKAAEVRNQVEQVSEKIKMDEQTNKDLEQIERIAGELEGSDKEWSTEEREAKEEEYKKILRSNPAVNAVIRASDKLRNSEVIKQNQKPSNNTPDRITPNSDESQFIVAEEQKNVWIKEGYFKLYSKANKLKVSLLNLSPGRAKMECSFVGRSEFPAWSFTIEEGEMKTFTKGDQKISIDFVRTGSAGRNPLKKAMFFNIRVLKKS